MAVGSYFLGGTPADRVYLGAELLYQRPAAPATGPAPAWRLSGAVTDTSLTVSTKTASVASVRVLLSTTADLASGRRFSTAAAPGTYGESKHAFAGLAAGTQYFYGVESDGALDTASVPGKVATTGASNFRFAASGCAGTGSNDPVFAAIAAENPRVFLHMGDAHYSNLATLDPATWAGAYDDWLSDSEQSKLWRSCAINYIGSDHDTGPNNNYLGMTRGYNTWAEFYRRYMPHYSLPSADNLGSYHTWLLDPDIRVISTDTRAYKSNPANTDDSSKTMMGAAQKQWFKDTLMAAAEPVIIWQQELSWNTLGAKAGSESWQGFNTERQELADFITSNGLSGRMYMVFSDTHAVGWAARADSRYGGFPIALVGPFDQTSPGTIGALTIGPIPSGDTTATRYHQYGIFDVTKTSTDVSIGFTGKRSDGTVQIPTQTVTFSRSLAPPAPAAFPADLPGLIARYRGAELGAIGSAIASWTSVDGTQTADQTDATKQPVVGAGPNGGKAAVFTSDVLMLPAAVRSGTSGVTGITAYVVAAATSVGSGAKNMLFLTSGASANSSRHVSQLSNTSNNPAVAYRRLDSDSVKALTAPGNSPVVDAWFIQTTVADYTVGDTTVQVDGTVLATGTTTVGSTSATASVTATIGAHGNGTSEFWPGPIAEVIIYGVPHTAAERSRMHAYLRDAHAIPVA